MSLGDFGRDMLAEAARIAQQTVAREGTHLRWATVTEVDPLRIRYDGEPNQSIVTPQTTAAGLVVGDRVQVAKQHGQAVIVGRAGGMRDTGWLSLSLAAGYTGSCRYRAVGAVVELRFDISGTVTGDTAVTQALPTEYRPSEEATGITEATAYIDPAGARSLSQVYMAGTGLLRATAGGGPAVSRLRGRAMWTI